MIYLSTYMQPHFFVSRCQSQEKRICITFRTTEGEYGDLLVTIVATLKPKKAAKVSVNELYIVVIYVLNMYFDKTSISFDML